MRDSCLRRERRAVAYLEVTGETDLAAGANSAAQAARAGQPCLGGKDAVFTHPAPVTYLNEIVDLGAPTDDRVADGRPVYGSIGSDLDIVLNDHASGLHYLVI